jgi:hypothetical protein
MNLTDDPTSYLTRDSDVVCILLAGSIDNAMNVARQYGVSIQVNMAGGKGIRVVTTEADARAIITQLPATTPWSSIADGGWTVTTYGVLYGFFGKPMRLDQAIGMITQGVAWLPQKTLLI